MRNPERINILLDCVEEKWNQVPDWRFGQLIKNVTAGHDLLYLSDERFFELLIAYFSNPKESEEIEIPEFKEFDDEVRVDPSWFF